MNPAPELQRDIFLRYLNPDPARAETEYELLRARLVFYFRHKSCGDPEMLADEVITVVLQKLAGKLELTTTLSGYCFGVAKNLANNYLKRNAALGEEFDERIHTPESAEPSAEDLILARQFMDRLKPGDRKLVTDFFREGTAAAALGQGISINAARIRVHRIIKEMRAFAKGEKE